MEALKDIKEEIENIVYAEMETNNGKDRILKYETIGEICTRAVQRILIKTLGEMEDDLECSVIENSHHYTQDCYYYTLGLIKSAFIEAIGEIEEATI